MKKTPSHDLFRLIKSLDKGEKRNFKLLAGVWGEMEKKPYVELFDMIDRQDVYNEPKLQRHFGALYGGQFSSLKNYLYTLILRSLSHYDDDPGAEIAAMRRQVRILRDKELFEQAQKLAHKAAHEAAAQENFPELLQILDLQADLLHLSGADGPRHSTEIDQLATRWQGAMERWANLGGYEWLYHRALAARQRNRPAGLAGGSDSSKDLIAQDPLMAGPEAALSVQAQLMYQLLGFVQEIEGGMAYDGRRFFEAIEQLFHTCPKALGRLKTKYPLVCLWLAGGLVLNHQFEEARSRLKAVKRLLDESKALRQHYTSHFNRLSMGLGLYSGEIAPAVEHLRASLQGKDIETPDPGSFYLLAVGHWMLGNPKQALQWNNLVLGIGPLKLRPMTWYDAKWLNLMVHFDLGNYSLVEAERINCRRYLEKAGLLGAYETSLLKGLKALLDTVGSDAYRDCLLRVKEAVSAAVDASSLAQFKERSLHFVLWLDSKLLGIPMHALVRQGLAAGKPYF